MINRRVTGPKAVGPGNAGGPVTTPTTQEVIVLDSAKEGILTMTCESGAQDYRLDILYPDGSYHGGLHCGHCLEVKQGKDWLSTRVESGYDASGEEAWYLVGLYKPGEIPYGLTVRERK